MKIHEYQAKALLAKYGVPVPKGKVVFTAEEAEAHRRVVGVGSTRSVPGRTLLQVGCEEHQRTSKKHMRTRPN